MKITLKLSCEFLLLGFCLLALFKILPAFWLVGLSGIILGGLFLAVGFLGIFQQENYQELQKTSWIIKLFKKN